jgi:flagella basal body P-ring formation protein FlgA
MTAARVLVYVFTALTCSVLGTAARGWEVELIGNVITTASILRLTDVAEIHNADADLQQILDTVILAPGPTGSHPRTLSSSDVRKMVERHGVNMAEGRFTGAARTTVTYGEPAADRASTPMMVKGIPNSQIRRLASQPVTSPTRKDSPRTPTKPHSASPSEAAKEGVPVVVAARELARGQRVRQDDVTVQYVEETELPAGALCDLEEVIGRETTRNVRMDQPFTARMIQKPLLVRKNEDVAMITRCGRVVVQRRGIAQDDGGLGDTVVVQTMAGTKKQLTNARVIDLGRVAVFADSVSVASDPSDGGRPK